MHAHHNPALFCDGRCGQDKTRHWGQPNSALAAWSKSHLCILSTARRETWTKAHLCILSTDRPESPTRTLGWPPGRRRASSPSPAHDPNRLGVYWSLGPPQPTRITQLAAGLALLSKSPRRCPTRRSKAHLCIMTPPRTVLTRILTAGAEPAVPLRPHARYPCAYGWQLVNPPNPPSLDPQRLATNERHATNGRRISTLHFLRSEPPWMFSP